MEGIGHLLIGLGEVLIASLTGGTTWFFINYYLKLKDQLYQPLIPVIVRIFIYFHNLLQFVALFGYTVGHLFMIVYGIAANTLLHCFLLDRELEGSMHNHG